MNLYYSKDKFSYFFSPFGFIYSNFKECFPCRDPSINILHLLLNLYKAKVYLSSSASTSSSIRESLFIFTSSD